MDESVSRIIRPIQIVRPVEIDWIKTVNESALLSALRASGYITQRNGGRPGVLLFLLVIFLTATLRIMKIVRAEVTFALHLYCNYFVV